MKIPSYGITQTQIRIQKNWHCVVVLPIFFLSRDDLVLTKNFNLLSDSWTANFFKFFRLYEKVYF